ncbi:MAG: class I SAM-dependent methyltransferase [Candidatus Omnitrophica bacterium]|nr:class I SAM-dependent methyltransferase [Candidatus Omnitrophota bacterium]
MDLQKFYENEAEREVLWGTPREKCLIEHIMRAVPAHVGSVLDAGCGDGYLLAALGKSRARIVDGLDCSFVRLRSLVKRLPWARVVQGKAEALPYKERSFDLVVASEVLEHIPDYSSALKELIRATRRDLVITVPNEQKVRRLVCPRCDGELFLDGHLHCFSATELTEMFHAHPEMELVRLKRFHTIYSYNSVTWRLPRMLRMFFDSCLVSLSRWVPFFKPNYILVHLTRKRR